MKNDCRPPCTYVSIGEEGQDLLVNLEYLDPYGKYDNGKFSKRVKKFLEKYEKEIGKDACTSRDSETCNWVLY